MKVLCILSWVWIGLMVLSTARNLFTGPPSQELIDSAKEQAISGQPEEQLEQMKWLYDDIFYVMDESVNRHYEIEGSYLAFYLLGLAATILMWKLRRAGYYMYLAYTIAIIGGAAYFYYGLHGTYMYFFGGAAFLTGGLFSVLYGVQLKRMK